MTTDPRALDEHAPAPAPAAEPPTVSAAEPAEPPTAPAAAAQDEAAPEPGPAVESQDGPESPARTSRRRRLAVTLLLVVVLLVATAGYLAWRSWTAAQEEQARQQAVEAAEQALPDILSYDYADLDDDISRARGRLTDAFAAEYDELASKTIRPTAEQYRAVVSAEVLASSVESADRDEASVLLFANQTTVTSELPAPRVDQSRVRMRLERTPSGWKVAAIEPL